MSKNLDSKHSSSNNVGSASKNPDNSKESEKTYEVFRNQSTAVEIIVKNISKEGKDHKSTSRSISHSTTSNLVDLMNLEVKSDEPYKRNEDNKPSPDIVSGAFNMAINEYKKQLDTAFKNEFRNQNEIITLKLENEKLKTLLEFQTKQVMKLKNEINNMGKVLKVVVNGMFLSPVGEINENLNSETEYESFELGLLKKIKVMELFDGSKLTNDSSLTREKSYLHSPKIDDL